MDSICVVVSAPYRFNMTVYGRSEHEVNYSIWDQYVNFSAQTFCFCLCGYIVDGWHQPMRYNTSYYWFVNASKFDNTSLFNVTDVFHFTTAVDRLSCVASSGGGGWSDRDSVIGVVGIFGIIGLIGYLRRRRK